MNTRDRDVAVKDLKMLEALHASRVQSVIAETATRLTLASHISLEVLLEEAGQTKFLYLSS